MDKTHTTSLPMEAFSILITGSRKALYVDASVALGVGANVLVGGFQKSIALQSVSVEGKNGLNIAAGIAGMSLNYEGSKRPR